MVQKAAKLKNILVVILALLLLLSGVFVVRGYLAGHFNSVETLQAYIATFGVFAPVILITIQAIQVILPVLPGFLGCIVGAGMFGAAGGFGATTSASVPGLSLLSCWPVGSEWNWSG